MKGERIGVDASTMEANAALRNIVRRDTGEGYRGMLEALGPGERIETPTAEDLARLDRKRKGKKLSNQDWVSRSDPEADRQDEGRHHAPGLQARARGGSGTGAVVVAELHAGRRGRYAFPRPWRRPRPRRCGADGCRMCADTVLKALDDGPRAQAEGFCALAHAARRTRLLSGVAREAFKPRRSSRPHLDRGGMRPGRERFHKRYLHSRRRTVADRGAHRRRHPEGGRARLELAPCSCLLRPLEPSWPFRSSHRLRGWRNRLRRDMLRRGTRQ